MKQFKVIKLYTALFMNNVFCKVNNVLIGFYGKDV